MFQLVSQLLLRMLHLEIFLWQQNSSLFICFIWQLMRQVSRLVLKKMRLKDYLRK